MAGGTATVDCSAVTKVTEEKFVFRWNIDGFKVCLKDKDPNGSELKSPVFRIDDGNITHEWYLTIKWSEKKKRAGSKVEDEYLSIFLNLVDCKTPAKITFQIEIFGPEKCWQSLVSSEMRKFDENFKSWGYDTFAKIGDIVDPVNKLLDDDTLKVQCHINMIRHAERIVSCSEPAKLRMDSLVSDFTDLYNNPTFTDVSIQTKNSAFKANKNILSCRSPVFSAMFQAEMKEAINNVVQISDFDDDVVDGMLKYIYSGEIVQDFLEKNAMDLFRIADKYDIKGLKEESEEVISRTLSVKNVSESLIFAEMNNAPNLKRISMKFFNMNIAEIKKTEGLQNLLKHSPSIFVDLYQAQ